ncbi:zinc finger protein 1 homolog isoform X2 [Pleurodeles waltl]|uniref:zinc finger protein 1 homolog isoform X2 n=1 Tax=Pleurodeles waltl TaxID=8319 RepID=UPI003709BAB1
MSRQESDETQVAFHDLSACFSQAEWRLLQEWQKELYRNVMKEIHQALISLGPLIATTVYTLKAKEADDMCFTLNQDMEKRHRTSVSPSRKCIRDNTNLDELFTINQEEQLYLDNFHDRSGCLSACEEDVTVKKVEEPMLIFNDHFDAEVEKSSSGPTENHDVVSFCIKEEEETDRLGNNNTNRLKDTSGSVDNADLSRADKRGHYSDHIKTTKPLKTSVKVDIALDSETTATSRSLPWSETNSELQRENGQCKSNFSSPTRTCLNHGIPKTGMPGEFDETESAARNTLVFAHQQNKKANWTWYKCTECEKGFEQSIELTRHMKTHTGKTLYQCIHCNKTFNKRSAFHHHQRTHTGERPYHCSQCEKSFSMKSTLNMHLRTHSGERPYQCKYCEQSFIRNDHLVLHERTHTGERPYKCTECEKSFSQKVNLTRHERTHHGERRLQGLLLSHLS